MHQARSSSAFAFSAGPSVVTFGGEDTKLEFRRWSLATRLDLRMNLRGELGTSAASSEPPHEPPRRARNLNGKPRPPPAAQPPGRAATSTTNRDLRRLLDLRGAATFATNSDPLTSQPPIPLFNQATRQLLMSPPHACKPHWHKISCCPRQRNRTQPNKTQLKVTFLSSRIFFSLSCHPRRFPLFARPHGARNGSVEHGYLLPVVSRVP